MAADVDWLDSHAGRGVIDEATALADGGRDALQASGDLRRAHPDLPADLVGQALTQARLRARAAQRLGADARHVLLTADGLEQATRASVARLRAARLAERLGADSPGPDSPGARALVIADLGCGIGSDSWALARAGFEVLAIERDPETAALAQANARALGLPVEVRCADLMSPEVIDSVVSRCAAAFLDPARRDSSAPRAIDGQRSRRLLDPDQWSPPWSFVTSLAARMPVVAKVAPGLDRALASSAELVLTSDDGDLVEASVWFPPLGQPGRRVAQVVRRGQLTSLASNSARSDDLPVGEPSTYLLDPDDAIVRADLLHLVLDRGGDLLDPRVAYVTRATAPEAGEHWLGTWYEVHRWLRFNVRELRWALADLGIGSVTITKRAFAGDVEDVRRQLRLRGDGRHATLILTRTDDGPLALICSQVR